MKNHKLRIGATVGANIDAYISNQLKEDRLNGQLTFEDVEPFKK